MNGLVVVFARPRLRIAPKVNAYEPGARNARNSLPKFDRAIVHIRPAMGHTSGTHGAAEIKLYRGLRAVLLIRGIQDVGALGRLLICVLKIEFTKLGLE